MIRFSRQLAYEAYISAVLAHSKDGLGQLETAASTLPVSTILVRETTLFKLVQRATKLATFDLLLPGPQACLRQQLLDAGYSSSASGLVVELQVASLEPSLDKAEAQSVIPAMLEGLLLLYTPARHPMRRARFVQMFLSLHRSTLIALSLLAGPSFGGCSNNVHRLQSFGTFRRRQQHQKLIVSARKRQVIRGKSTRRSQLMTSGHSPSATTRPFDLSPRSTSHFPTFGSASTLTRLSSLPQAKQRQPKPGKLFGSCAKPSTTTSLVPPPLRNDCLPPPQNPRSLEVPRWRPRRRNERRRLKRRRLPLSRLRKCRERSQVRRRAPSEGGRR